MADWFKFYETDLFNERLRWAMSEQQQVAIVYVTILSRCCRDKVGTLSWSGEDFELFALAQECMISAPIANQCLQLLVKIGFLSITDNLLKVLQWNERQSEYCQKRSKVSPDSVPTLSRQSPDTVGQEERRGDKKRKEKSTASATALLIDRIYEAYPKKVGKPAAMKAISKALTSTPFETLMEATLKYARSRHGQDSQFTPHPATWFNQQRYNDPQQANGHPSQSRPETQQEYMDRVVREAL